VINNAVKNVLTKNINKVRNIIEITKYNHIGYRALALSPSLLFIGIISGSMVNDFSYALHTC